ncbi:MAG: tetratricopeptide repeat protein [Chloroflexi bacterium]|nr:tetratricopeptide repeat protein [Chloroflexota bacterium]
MEPSAENLITAGKQAFQKGDFQAAIRSFSDAAAAYEKQGNLPDAAEAKNNLSVALLQADRPDEALEAVIGTEEIFAEAKDTLRQAMAIGNQAAALDALNRGDEALTAYERSAELFAQIGESDLQATVLKSAAGIKLRRGKFTESAMTMMASLDTTKKPSLFQRLLKFLLRLKS